MNIYTVTLATKLTLARLILSPLLLPFLIVWFVPVNNLVLNSIVALFFIMLGLTDFFDGYIARHYSQITVLGKVLDPIADKFLVYATLIALLAIHKIYYYWVIILIGREFFIMGLRLIAQEYSIQIPVSSGGKIKTAVQMLLLLALILNPYYGNGLAYAPVSNGSAQLLLIATLFLSLFSAAQYYKSFITQLSLKE